MDNYILGGGWAIFLIKNVFQDQVMHGFVCGLLFSVHFFALLWKTTTWNEEILCCPENMSYDSYFIKFIHHAL